MLSVKNKQLLKNVGFSIGNYGVVFTVFWVLCASALGAWSAGWLDLVSLMLMDKSTSDFILLKWALGFWGAVYISCNWILLNFAVRAYKRQKAIKWE